MNKFSKDSLLLDPPPLGCVLYLPGLPGSASKTYDRSPYGNIGTITGATWVRLPSGLYAPSFDGIDDYILFSSGLVPLGAKTVITWVTSTNAAVQYFLDNFQASGSVKSGFALRLDADGNVRAILGQAGYKLNFATIGLNLADGVWHQIVFTWDGTTAADKAIIYTDGAQRKTGTSTSTEPLPSTHNLHLGNLAQPYSGYGFIGKMALVRMFNRCLTALEVQNAYNEEKRLF